MTRSIQEWTPPEIVAELDQYVVGQAAAKRSVAIALRNRFRRQLAPPEIREEILPNNILMIGPTGVGKTEIARRLAKLAGAPFLKVEASKFTEVGYVGRDVESMVRDLAEISVSMVRQETADRLMGRARKHVEERLLNLLLPRHKRREMEPDATGEQEWEERRRSLRADLRSGELNQKVVEIDTTGPRAAPAELLAQLGLDESQSSWSEALEQLFPRKKKRRRVMIEEAQRILLQEETRRIVDMDEVVRTALDRVQSTGIIFIDEIDKVCGPRSHTGPDVSREGVQRDLLPIVEGSSVATRHGVVRTDHILFIAAGAFHACRPSDLLPELQGRFPIRVELSELGAHDLLRILKEPRNSLVRQYQALLAAEKVELRFTPEALDRIAAIAHAVNQTTENIGARRLHTVLNTLLEEVLFNVPSSEVEEIVIGEQEVEDRLGGIARDKDLSRYIL